MFYIDFLYQVVMICSVFLLWIFAILTLRGKHFSQNLELRSR